MSNVVAFTKQETTISAVVTRANGTVEDLGDISYSHTNPFKTFTWYLRHPEQWVHKASKFLRWIKGFVTS